MLSKGEVHTAIGIHDGAAVLGMYLNKRAILVAWLDEALKTCICCIGIPKVLPV